jgi:hypothetical protein
MRIISQSNNSNLNYPATLRQTDGKDMFGGGYVCYGSLYFPKFRYKNDDYCSGVVESTTEVRIPNGFKYKSSTQPYSLMDITYIMKKFKPFAGTYGWPVSSAYHGIPNFNTTGNQSTNPGWHCSTCGANVGCVNAFDDTCTDEPNQVDQTYPLRNNPLGSAAFPQALNDEQSPITVNNVIYNSFKVAGQSSTTVDSIQDGDISLQGRYFFYFGLTESKNIISYIKNNEDV